MPAGYNPLAMTPSLVFSTVLVLVVLVLVAGAVRPFSVAEKDLVGYWAAPEGHLFELLLSAPDELRLATASGFHGAVPGETYRVVRRGFRRISAELPRATLRGRAGLDRRRILWDDAPTWYRQGL